MKRLILSLLALVTLIVLTGCGSEGANHTEKAGDSQTAASTKSDDPIKKSAVPTLFIHGYGGTVNSFGGMIRRMSNEKMTKKEMTITVEPDGTLQVDGRLTKEKNNPSIQVLFASNKDNEWNQSEWIYTVLKYLKEQGVSQVNLVGHSMGGVSSLRYLTTYGQPSDAPTIKKFVAIGAPFNDFNDTSKEQSIDDVLQTGPSPEASRYIDYSNGINNVPSQLPVLLLAGKLDKNATSDGTVPITSALATYALLKSNGNPVKQQVFTGSNAQHSQLHENLAVDKTVANFLWK